MWLTFLVAIATLLWLGLLIAPWRPWGTRESLDIYPDCQSDDLSDVTVLIPARNESGTIGSTLSSLESQGQGLKVLLVDDQSTDDTVVLAGQSGLKNLTMIAGKQLPVGWTGKLWALEQGRSCVKTRYTLLLDADISLSAGIVCTMLTKMHNERIHFLSLMAALRMQSFWEKLLIPAFIYFFKLVYPFHLANKNKSTRVAAAAGGCILLETQILNEIGGFAVLRNALIDDCLLARCVKKQGFHTWIGLTHSVVSTRTYDSLRPIWQMAARNAYTQLNYSPLLLTLVTILMLVLFIIPIAGLFVPDLQIRMLSLMALILSAGSYLPILLYYNQPKILIFALPVIGLFYLAMTWSSAIRYWRGTRSHWKDRVYGKDIDTHSST